MIILTCVDILIFIQTTNYTPMKTITLSVLFVLFSIPAFCQIDVTVNPLGLLFKNIGVSAEKPIKDNIGLEGTLNFNFNNYSVLDEDYKSTGYGIRAIGKYYFNPDKGIDKFNVGPYLRMGGNTVKYVSENVKNFRIALGVYAGYKWVSKNNVVFELGLGAGRALVNNYSSDDNSFNAADWPILNLDFTGKLAIGYRF